MMKRSITIPMILALLLSFSCSRASKPKVRAITPDLSTQTAESNAYGQTCKVISKDGLTVFEYKYDGSYFLGGIVTFYLENLGGGGDYEFNMKLTEKKIGALGPEPAPEGSSMVDTVILEEGRKYALRVHVLFGNSMSTMHGSSTILSSKREFTVEWVSSGEVMDTFSFEAPAWDASLGFVRLVKLAEESDIPQEAKDWLSPYPIRVRELAGAFGLREKLCGEGFNASLPATGDGWQSSAEEHQAVWVGESVPVEVVSKVIKSAREEWPLLRYVDFSDSESEVYLGGPTRTVEKRCLKPWTDEEFAGLDAGITLEEFHALIRSHYPEEEPSEQTE